jgi:hypothetical protein
MRTARDSSPANADAGCQSSIGSSFLKPGAAQGADLVAPEGSRRSAQFGSRLDTAARFSSWLPGEANSFSSRGARQSTLKDISVRIPIGQLTALRARIDEAGAAVRETEEDLAGKIRGFQGE